MALSDLAQAAAVRSQRHAAQPQDEDSLLSRAFEYGQPVLSGLAKVGNALDLFTGASSVRDVIGGVAHGLGTGEWDWEKYNPFDQFIPGNWTTHHNRTSGRDLISEFGVDKNKETGISGWADDPMEAVRDLGGFGAELLLDPASWLGFGTIAKAYGAAGRAAAKPAAAGIRMVPGGGALLDTAADVGGKVGRGLRASFDSRVYNRTTPEVQDSLLADMPSVLDDTAAPLATRELAVETHIQGKLLPILDELERRGLTTAEDAVLQRSYGEGVRDIFDPKIREMGEFATQAVDTVRDVAEQVRLTKKKWGVGISSELDDVIQYMARRLGAGRGKSGWVESGVSNGPLSGHDAAEIARQQTWKGWHRGTEHINEVVTAKEADEIITNLYSHGAERPETVEAVEDWIRTNHGEHIDEFYDQLDEAGNIRYTDLYDVARDEVLGREMAMWEADQPFRDFRQAYPNWTNAANREGDQAGLLGWDEVAGDFLKDNPQHGTLDDLWERLKEEPAPPPRKSDAAIREEASELEKSLRAQRKDLVAKVGRDEAYQQMGQQPVQANRYKEIAEKMVDNPEIREQGLFTNHWITDAKEKLTSELQRVETAKTVYGILNAHSKYINKQRLTSDFPHTSTVGQILKDLKFNGNVAAERMLEMSNVDVAMLKATNPKALNKLIRKVKDRRVMPEVAKDLRDEWANFKAPPEVSTAGKLWDSYTNWFKAGALTHPARFVRDFLSAQARLIEDSIWDFRSGVQSHRILQGRAVAELAEVPAFQKWMRENMNIDPATATPEQVSQAVRQMYAAYRASPTNMFTDVAGVGRQPGAQTGGIEEMLSQIPGRTEMSAMDAVKHFGKTFFGRTAETDLNPRHIRGVMQKGGEVATESNFGPVAAGDMWGAYTDNMGRLTGWLNQVKKGVDPAEAMARVNKAQVDYHPRAFTATERQIKRLFPFYSFTSRQIPWLINSLINNPGGNLGKLIRAQRNMSDEDPSTPQYVAETGGIPLGESPDGTKSYITGLGLMHEDPLTFMSGGVQGGLAELGSRLGPVPKSLIEWATQESLFQRGPLGGRDIDDLDPIMGRTLQNVKQGLGYAEPGYGTAEPVGGKGLEFLFANSPFSRIGSTARVLTDTRKKGWNKAMNALTGIKVSDISPAAQDAVLRDTVNAVSSDLDAKKFTNYYFPKELVAELKKTNPELADRMEALNQLRNLKSRQAKERKKAKK